MKKVAFLIDTTQFNPKDFLNVLTQISHFGKVVVVRAYGVWTPQSTILWHKISNDYQIELMDNPVEIKKNPTHSVLITDAVSLFYTQQIDCFCLAVSNVHYVPLFYFLHSNGASVKLFYDKNSSGEFKSIIKQITHQAVDTSTITIHNLDNQILEKIILDNADTFGWVRTDQLTKYLHQNYPDLKPAHIGIVCKEKDGFITKGHNPACCWVKAISQLDNSINDNLQFLTILVKCLEILQLHNEKFSLGNITGILHNNNIFAQNYGYKNYLSLLLSIKYLKANFNSDDVTFNYSEKHHIDKKLTKAFLFNEFNYTPKEIVWKYINLPEIQKVSDDDIGILCHYIKKLQAPTTELVPYVLLRPLLNDHPELNSRNFGYQRWLDLFYDHPDFTVITQNHQEYIGYMPQNTILD